MSELLDHCLVYTVDKKDFGCIDGTGGRLFLAFFPIRNKKRPR